MPPKQYLTNTTLHVGVLLAPPPVQLLDLAPVDLFHMLSKEYIGGIPMFPDPVKKLALENVQVFYIADNTDPVVATHHVSSKSALSNTKGSSQRGESATAFSSTTLTVAPLTANLSIVITSTLASPEVQPGKLSVLLVPGPDPTVVPSEAYCSFIRAHASSGKTDIISICTGIYPVCHAGICDNLTVTGPRGLLPDLRSKFSNVRSFEDTRWSKNELRHSADSASHGTHDEERQAELWTAAGITNGHDCIAAYLREHFDRDLAEIVCRMADVGDRPKAYGTGQLAENMWWVSRILRAVVKGLWK